MLSNITHSFINVFDQDEAVDFYVNKLGMEVRTDADLGVMRWLTVGFPGHDFEVVLMKPGAPVHSAETAEEVRELVAKGAAGGGLIFATADARATFQQLQDAGVEITQEVIEQPYGIDFAIRDPFGNPLRITQPLG